jgi:hypothetical protein
MIRKFSRIQFAYPIPRNNGTIKRKAYATWQRALHFPQTHTSGGNSIAVLMSAETWSSVGKITGDKRGIT